MRSVGRFGTLVLPSGLYAYCGSALGPGGIRGRVSRHLRPGSSLHWHIDLLRPLARPVALVFAVGDSARECVWSQRLGRLEGASFPIPGFGASDCRRQCPAHLVLLPAGLRPTLPPEGAGPSEKERTCAEKRQALKEAILFSLETRPHGS